MFTIVISEKGGAERRETFEKGEISVGRVQGNDLMLPKGNVSKHHARLLCRDGRFIVTDLKSTNGTYVNGRKTSQATIVREGDKIYIGDFVLRLETGQATASSDAAHVDPAAPRPQIAALLDGLPAGAPLGAVGGPASAQASVPPAAQRAQELSHYPLERDPDSESAPELAGAPIPQVPGPPRLPNAMVARSRPVSMTPVAPARAAASRPRPPSAPEAPLRSGAAAAGFGPRESPKQSARRVALITLVDRIADVVDLAPLDHQPDVDPTLKDQIERAARQEARAMRSDGEAPDGVDLDQLVGDAVRELVGLGPIGPALEDDETTEIHVARADWVILKGKGEKSVLAEAPFTSEEAVHRVIARLAHRAGHPLGPGEACLERRLPSGAALVAFGPPLANNWVLTLRKRIRAEGSLAEFVRGGAMSRPMADFLSACVEARCNILVVGAGPGTVGSVLAALGSAAPSGARVAVLQDEEEIVVPEAQVVALWAGGNAGDAARLVSTAARFGVQRVIVAALASTAGLATLDAVAEGREGVLAGCAAPTLRHGLARLVAKLSSARPGTSIETARELIAGSFDVAIEVGRDRSGKVRFQRISELSTEDAAGLGVRDIFVSSSEPSGTTSFSVAGNVPRVAEDFAPRGIQLDTALFRRSR